MQDAFAPIDEVLLEGVGQDLEIPLTVSKGRYAFSALVCLLLWSFNPLYAQSVLDFPRVISAPDLFTGIAITNPTPDDASVTFTAYLTDGKRLSGNGIRNPVTITLPAGSQHARLSSEIFGSGTDFNGWVQATSSTSGLTGFSLNGTSAATDFDGTVAVSPASDFWFPFVSGSGAAITELTVANIHDETVNAVLTLYAADGTASASKQIALPARGMIRQTLHSLFGPDLTSASHVRVQSTRSLIGYQVVADFELPATTITRETIAQSAQEATNSKTSVIPQFATGGEWLSYFGLVNASGLLQEVTLTAFREDGTKWDLPENPKHVELGPHASMRSTVRDLFGFSDDTLSTGWIEVRSTLGFVIGYIGYGNIRTPSFAVVSATDLTATSKVLVYSHIAEGDGYFTGMTVVNAAAEPADVDLFILRPDGTTIGRAGFSIPAGGRVGKLFRELLPASLTQVGGWIFLRSTQPLAGAVLFGDTSGSALASVPQQVGGSGFPPPDQKVAAITGTVRQADGTAVSDLPVTLNGQVDAGTRTDGSGRYVFLQLPTGDYTVTAGTPGFDVSPLTRSISLGNTNADGVDFRAVKLASADRPVIRLLTPSSAFAGNGPFQIGVIGQNFTPASLVELNGALLPATFVDETRLNAAVPPNLTNRAGAVSVTVMTPGSGRSNPLELMLSPIPQNPLLAGSIPVGSYPAGVAVDSSLQIALVANEASDTVTILDLRTLSRITDVVVQRSPSDGVAIHAAKKLALVSNAGSDSVSVIDLRNYAVIRTISVGRFPLGVAINSITNRAVVVNGEGDSVSILDLDSLTVLRTIAVGLRPASVAINPRTNEAVVSNRASDTVSVIDLVTFTISATIPVRSFPRGVAIHAQRNIAVVANANSADVSVIDLAARSVIATIGVGSGPTAVAITPVSNAAVITNSGIVRGNLVPGDPAGLSSVSILSLDSMDIVATVPVGAAAFGVDVDSETLRAFVSNFGSNDVFVVRLPNPIPKIQEVLPKTFQPGGGPVTIRILGTGFLPVSVATLGGRVLPTTYVSSTEIAAIVGPEILSEILMVRPAETVDSVKVGTFRQSTPVQFDIGVTNPGPGGGSSPPAPAGQGHITVENHAPVFLSMSPLEATTGAGFVLTINGNNFNGSTAVNFGTGTYFPTSLSATLMRVSIPASELNLPGPVSVSITNPAPGGGTTASQRFTILGNLNPSPVVNSVSPHTIAAGAGDTPVTISGNGFSTLTKVSIAGAEVPASATATVVSFAIPRSRLSVSKKLDGMLVNPRPGGGTAAFSINVVNGVPTISSFSPTRVAGGAASLEITVRGAGFAQNAEVMFENVAVVTRFISAFELRATLGSAFLQRVGSFRVGVSNPSPGGGYASAGMLAVGSARPTIVSVTPPIARVSSVPLMIRISGSSLFINSIVRVQVAGGAPEILPAVQDTDDSLLVTLPVSMLARTGTLSITVVNPGPGGESLPATLPVENPVPTLLTLDPVAARVDQPGLLLTVEGRDFVAGATIVFGSVTLPTTFVSSSMLTAYLPMILSVGDVEVTVQNLRPGGVSTPLTFRVLPVSTPVLSTVTTSTAVVGSAVTVEFTGANFVRGATSVSVGGGNVTVGPVNVIDSNTLSVTLSVAPGAALGDRIVTVTTSGGISNSLLFTILPPAPTLNEVHPTSGAVGSTVDVVLAGTNLVAGATTVIVSGTGVTVSSVNVAASSIVSLSGQAKVTATTFTSNHGGSTLSSTGNVTLTIDPGAELGPRSLTVTTPGGTTGGVTFNITTPVPTLDQLSSTFGVVGGALNLTLTGTNFVPGATMVTVSGTGVTVGSINVINATSLSVALEVDSTAAVGARNVTVSTANGTSNALSFSILTPVGPTLDATALEGTAGASVNVTLSGTNFVAGVTVVTVSGSGVAVTDVNVINPTTLTARLSIDPTALIGTRQIIVQTPNGTSNPVTFDILPAAPALNSVLPVIGVTGTSVVLTLSGSNFVSSSTTVTVSGPGVTLGSVNVAGSTSLTTTLTIAASARLGDRDVTVATAGGSSAPRKLTIVAPSPLVPTLTGVSSQSAVAGTSVNLVLSGTNFVAGATTVGLSGAGATVSSVNVTSTNTLTATLALDLTASFGSRDLTVTTAAGTSNAKPFNVLPPAPTLSAVSPGAGIIAGNSVVTLSGAYFISGATTIAIDGAGVSISDIQVANSTSLTAKFTIDANATIGTRNVSVITPGGTSNARPFSVQAITPALNNISPASGLVGTSNDVTLTGSDFIAGVTTVSISGTGVTASSPIVNGTASLTVTFSIDALATVGPRTVTVTTPGGTSLAKTFTVLSPVPTLDELLPNAYPVNTSIQVTMTGGNFISGGTSVTVSGTGVTVGSINVTSSTTLTAIFDVHGSASLGLRDVTVTTSGGTSVARTVTILPPPPTLVSVSPSQVTVGELAEVVLTGTGFLFDTTTVKVSGTGVSVLDWQVMSPTLIRVLLSVDPSAAVGLRDISVTTRDGQSNPKSLEVLPPY